LPYAAGRGRTVRERLIIIIKGDSTMPKGQEKKKTQNKAKLTVKEKKAKKKEKAAK
jgi:hypothetical protein